MGQRLSRGAREGPVRVEREQENSSQNPLSAATGVIDGADTLQLVVILHRHGARFPNSSIPNDLNWPRDKQFWAAYGGELTPTGSEQHVRLGRNIGQRYVQGSSLFDGVEPQEMRTAARVYTSNVQRTIFSAWSFLQGMFPTTPKHIAYLNDREDLDMDEIESRLQQSGTDTGIAINVESSVEGDAKKDELFHQMEINPIARTFRKQNPLKSPVVRDMVADPDCVALVDKLYQITQSKKLDPNLPMAERIVGCKAIVTQINIAQVHHMAPLPNPLNLDLSATELKILYDIGDAVWEGWYKPAESDRVEDGIGPESCGFLAAEIARCLADKRDGVEWAKKLKFLEFSCHDTNVLALAGLLGVTIDAPFFTGHWLLELHKSPTNQWSVRVMYNANPTAMGPGEFMGLIPRQLPLDGTFRAFSDLPAGEMRANALIDYLDRTSGFGKTARELRSVMLALRSADGKEKLRSCFVQQTESSVGALAPARARELEAAFEFLDTDHSGSVSPQELHAVFRRIGVAHVTPEEINTIVFICDSCSEPGRMNVDEEAANNERQIDIAEFKHMMAAMDNMAEDIARSKRHLLERVHASNRMLVHAGT